MSRARYSVATGLEQVIGHVSMHTMHAHADRGYDNQRIYLTLVAS